MHLAFKSKPPAASGAMRVAVEIVVSLLGALLRVFALAATNAWLDRHFMPSYFVSRHARSSVLSLLRVAAAATSVLLALVLRPRVGRWMAPVSGRALLGAAVRILLAAALAIGVSEIVLRRTFRHSASEEPASEVPHRRLDGELGWVFAPNQTSYDTVAGRRIEYAFDSSGYRVRRSTEGVDAERPAVLFTGESIMVGQGLNWEETVPAQVESMLGVQSANLAVHGFSTQQAYLRLVAELPRFRHPVAVVTLFTPDLFNRNMDDDRPHVGPDMAWVQPRPRWRLALIAGILVPYRSEETIERGVATTRAVLRATVELAQARGAVPLIVVPQFLPEDRAESELRHRILDGGGLPYVWVGLDPKWRLPGDQHPDAQAAQAMAVAISGYLRHANIN